MFHSQLIRCLVSMGAILIMSLNASAEVIVVQSTASGLRAGSTIADGTVITIPAGKQAIFVLPSGATRTVSGPFKGKAAELTKGVKSNPDLMAAIKSYVETGGSNQRNVGAVRSAAPRIRDAPIPFSWNAIPISARGDICVGKGQPISLTRAKTHDAQTLSIVDLASKQRVSISFAAGDKSADWPTEIPLNSQSTYALLISGRPMGQIRIHFIEPLPSREHTLQVLHAQRCQNQFRAFVRELKGEGGVSFGQLE